MAKKNSKYWHTILHRDIAYFYVGLIIAFSISGIALNHRQDFDSQEYIVNTVDIQLNLPSELSTITEKYLKNETKSFTDNEFRGFRLTEDVVRIYFEDAYAHINLQTGKGEIEYVETIPVLGQMTILHKTSNIWWIWFSDIFGLAMLAIAITGMFISNGNNSFKKRGWKLAIIGLVFPFIFLFFLN